MNNPQHRALVGRHKHIKGIFASPIMLATGLSAAALGMMLAITGCGGSGSGSTLGTTTSGTTTNGTTTSGTTTSGTTTSGTTTSGTTTSGTTTSGTTTSGTTTSGTTTAGSTTSGTTTSGTTDSTIVGLANTYINSLTATQQSATVVSATAANAAKWTNLPATPNGSAGTTSSRNGVSYSTLTTAQKTAWNNLVNAVLGSNNALNQYNGIRASDNYLGTRSNGYSGDYQYIGFVGAPSTSSGWLLQIGGHHIAHNYYYSGSALQTTTPYFLGVEPTSFTYNGTAYTPLAAQRNGMYNLINSLSSTQLASAKLSSSFSDVLLGPGKDARSNFPTGTTGRGILASNLSSAQKTLITTAIAAWTNDSPKASTYQSLYASEVNSTYVAYSGNTSLSSQGDYVRIDGPHVWIEFVCQNGVVIQGQIHYHTIWRDRVTDYNAAYGF